MAELDDIKMRILLRNWKTGLYLQKPDTWSEDRYSATDFERVASAIEHTVWTDMKDVEVVLAFPDQRLAAGIRVANED